MTFHWHPRLWLVALAGAGLSLCAGCRVFVDGIGFWRAPEMDERVESSARSLASDRWTPNTGWSPLHELPDVPNPDFDVSLRRWTHPQFGAALRSAEQTGLISTEARHAAERPGAGPCAGTGDAAINAWFGALARKNDLPGWNAAILWAHYDPIAARAAVDVLSHLVEHPPRYRPQQVADAEPERFRADGRSAANDVLNAASKSTGKPVPAAGQVVSPNLRCAAAEAWCLVLGAASGDPEENFAAAGRALDAGQLPSKIANELMLGIARGVSPVRIKQLALALDSTDERNPKTITARRAAAEACLVHAVHLRRQGSLPPAGEAAQPELVGDDPGSLASAVDEDAPWPRGVWALRNDSDPRLRRRLGELTAVIRHPAGFKILKGQLADVDSQVRESALGSLGILGNDAARHLLAEQARRPEDRIREQAMRGLACDGSSALAPFANDKSAKVRAELARCLRRQPGAEAARLLRDLIADPSTEVQAAAVRTIRDWPETQATPLLLEALAGSTLKIRTAALEQLEERHSGGVAFPLKAGPQERAVRVRQLMREWDVPDSAVVRARELTRPGSPLLDQARLADLREKLEGAGTPGANEIPADVAGWVGDLTPAELPLVERLLETCTAPQVDVLLHQVLPRLSPAYEALVQMESADAALRRSAASELSRIGEAKSLSAGICRRLETLLKTEQDGLVWRFAMQAIARDDNDDAARISLLALNSHWPDVRGLGCEFFGRHGRSEHAAWLMPLFIDANRGVQLAAVEAAGKCRNPLVLDGLRPQGDQAGFRGLRPLLTESQGQLQFAVVTAMSRLGDPQAMQELVRLSLDVNSTSRQEVVQIMGESGQTRFVESLIRLVWTERNPHVRQAALASLQKLVPAGEQPPRLPQVKTPPEAVEIWVAWWEDHQSRSEPEAGISANRN